MLLVDEDVMHGRIIIAVAVVYKRSRLHTSANWASIPSRFSAIWLFTDIDRV